jgi:hypothetical protein
VGCNLDSSLIEERFFQSNFDSIDSSLNNLETIIDNSDFDNLDSASEKFVDDVIPNIGGADSRPAIEKANPDIVAIGSDWARKDYYKQMGFTQDWLDTKGIILMYVPYTHGISTTDIKQRI